MPMLPPIMLQLSREELEFGPHAHAQHTISETFPMHTHDFYEIFLVLNGKAIHRVNNQTQLMEKGSLVFMRPADIHYYVPINKYDLSILNVGLPEMDLLPVLDYLDIPLSRITDPPLPVHLSISGSSYDFLADKLTRLAQIFPSKKCRPLLRSFLCELYAPLVLLEDGEQTAEIVPPWLSELEQQMNDPDHFIRGVSWIYSFCPYSKEHVIRSFRRFFHMTPTEYVNSKRLAYACELILEKKYSATEICYMAGFNNLSHFYHVFRDTYQCTPRDFVNRPQ